METGFYIHIPFCRKKCIYCGFFSGFFPEESLLSKYVDYICKEISLYRETGFSPHTIYIGGGTPSLLSESQIEKIANFLQKNFSKPVEFTIEANPEDITIDKAKCFLDNGINRISLGFQTMDDTTLKLLGRRNTSESNRKSYEILRKVGFKNISIDFISSIFKDDANEIIGYISYFDAEHYSVYFLSIDENTLLYKKYKNGEFIPISDEEYISNYNKIRNFMKKKEYLYYEVSNFAKDIDFISFHNNSYWSYLPYVGIGIGATGFTYDNEVEFKGKRWNNVKNFRDYFEMLDEKKLPIKEIENIDIEIATREFVMLGLRKVEGFKIDDFERIFKKGFYEFYNPEEILGLKKYLKINKKRIALKNNAFPVMNRVISKIWDARNKI